MAKSDYYDFFLPLALAYSSNVLPVTFSFILSIWTHLLIKAFTNVFQLCVS